MHTHTHTEMNSSLCTHTQSESHIQREKKRPSVYSWYPLRRLTPPPSTLVVSAEAHTPALLLTRVKYRVGRVALHTHTETERERETADSLHGVIGCGASEGRARRDGHRACRDRA